MCVTCQTFLDLPILCLMNGYLELMGKEVCQDMVNAEHSIIQNSDRQLWNITKLTSVWLHPYFVTEGAIAGKS